MRVITYGENLENRTGNIYRLYRDDHLAGGKCYIGSSVIPYFSVRLCQHRKKWREGKEYGGLFQEGSDPHVEFLESYDFKQGDQSSIIHLREREQFYYDAYKETCINIRRPRPDVKDMSKQHAYQAKYDRSERGRLILRRSFITLRLKRGEVKRQETVTKYCKELMEIQDRIKELDEIKKENKNAIPIDKIDEKIQSITSFGDISVSPPELHQDQ